MCHAPMMVLHALHIKFIPTSIYFLLQVFRQPHVFKDEFLPGTAEDKLALTQRSTIIYNLASF